MISSESKRSWTIGFVNFHTSYYLEWQLKILYEFNDAKDFQVIIIDNSKPSELILNEIISKYYNKEKNIKVISNNSQLPAGSPQHGEGMEIILKNCDTKYLMVQDPDFFWVRKGYLNILTNEFQQGASVIGTPSRFGTYHGKPDFPDVYGCAYIKDKLKTGDFMPELDEKKEEKTNFQFLGKQFERSHDTSWLIRKRLSKEKYISFEQAMATELPLYLGCFSWENYPCEYFYNNYSIGFHLFRGSVPCENNLLEKGVGEIFQRSDWVNVRKKYAEIFYKITKSPLSKIIFKIKITYIQLSSGIENSYIIRDGGLSSYLQNYHEPKFMDILIRKILSFFVAPKPKKQNHL